MPFMKFTQVDDAEVPFVHVEREGGPSTRLFLPRKLGRSPVFGEPTTALFAAGSILGAHFTRIIPNYSPSGIKALIGEQLKPMCRHFVSTRDKAIARTKELDAQQQDWLKPSKPIDQQIATEIRLFLRPQKVADKMHLGLTVPEIAAVLIDNPLLSGLSPDLIERIKPIVIENNLVHRYANQNVKKPSVDDLLASGPDHDFARHCAREAMKGHEQSREEITDVRNLLSSTIDFVSVVADVPRAAGYEMLTAA